MTSRFEYNQSIIELPIIKHVQSQLSWDFISDVETYVEKYPNQRFGQIITNYICQDYLDGNLMTSDTHLIMSNLFNDLRYDPFFEESKESFERLSKLTIRNHDN